MCYADIYCAECEVFTAVKIQVNVFRVLSSCNTTQHYISEDHAFNHIYYVDIGVQETFVSAIFSIVPCSLGHLC